MNLWLSLTQIHVKQRIALGSFLLCFIGMFLELRAFMSLGMITLGLQFFLSTDLKIQWKAYWANKTLVLLSIPLWVYALTFFYTEDKQEWASRIALKLPLLLVPMGLQTLLPFPRKFIRLLLMFFLLFTALVALVGLWRYLQNAGLFNISYQYAKTIPLPFGLNHIRYSLMMAFGLFACGYLLREELYLWKAWENRIILVLGVAVFVFLHILSVRSGLLAFYASLGFWFLIYTFRQRQYLKGLLMIAALGLLPVMGYFLVPTMKAKIAYMMADVSAFLNGQNVNGFSDGNRLLSMQIAYEAGKKSLWTGVGVGDVKPEMDKQYRLKFPGISENNFLTPHNQWAYIFLGCGLPGMLVCLIAFLSPLWREKKAHYLFIAALMIIFSSTFSEATFETQLGMAVYIMFFALSYLLHQALALSKTK